MIILKNDFIIKKVVFQGNTTRGEKVVVVKKAFCWRVRHLA